MTAAPQPPKQAKLISLSNQSMIFELFGEDEKLTITEITDRANEKLKQLEKTRVSEQTVRRAVKNLLKTGFIRDWGRQRNAQVYGKISAGWADKQEGESEKLLTLAGKLVTVEDFLQIIADEESHPHPFTLKVRPENWPISDEFQRKLRKRLTMVVLSSVDVGYSDALKKQAAFLQNHINELEYTINVMRTFLDSPIWFAQYRDRISREIRRVHEKNPELFELAVDYTKGD